MSVFDKLSQISTDMDKEIADIDKQIADLTAKKKQLLNLKKVMDPAPKKRRGRPRKSAA